MMVRLKCLLLGVVAASLFLPIVAAAQPQAGPERWEDDIRTFEDQDRQDRPDPGAVLFVGSSSIRLWDVGQAFPTYRTINRGFGGSQIADTLHYFDRIVLPYQPRAIVFYAGDNDVAAGRSAAEVAATFTALLERLTARLPETDIVYLGIKPSPARWAKWEVMRDANARIKALIERHPRAHYVDTASPLLGEDGRPDPRWFQDDKLHLSAEGYARWQPLVRRALQHAGVPVRDEAASEQREPAESSR